MFKLPFIPPEEAHLHEVGVRNHENVEIHGQHSYVHEAVVEVSPTHVVSRLLQNCNEFLFTPQSTIKVDCLLMLCFSAYFVAPGSRARVAHSRVQHTRIKSGGI